MLLGKSFYTFIGYIAVMIGLGFGSASAATGCIGSGASCFTTTTVQINITPGDLCVGITGIVNVGTFTASSVSQIVSGPLFLGAGYFYVDDLKGSNSGYYTTVQISNNLISTNGSVLSGSNVFMKTAAQGNAGITTLAGAANTNVIVHAGMSAFQSLDTARQLIVRNTGTNNGLLGSYGVAPQMQLIIPAYQAVGNYSGTLVYTLYTN